MELAQKRAEEATVFTLKTQISKIDSLKKIHSVVHASISQIKELTYTLSQVRRRIKYLENLENERSVRGNESLLGDPQWMKGSQDKRDTPRSYK